MKRVISAAVVAGLLFLVLVPFFAGCKPAADTGGVQSGSTENVLWRNELFGYAVESLFGEATDMSSVEMRQQTMNSLDQWIRRQKPLDDWQPDPVFAGVSEQMRTLGEEVLELANQIGQLQQTGVTGSIDKIRTDLRSTGEHLNELGMRAQLAEVVQLGAEMVAMADEFDRVAAQNAIGAEQAIMAQMMQLRLADMVQWGSDLRQLGKLVDPLVLEFPVYELFNFQETVWLRDISRWAQGKELDNPVKPATALFDWVVKNVQLDHGARIQLQEGQMSLLQKPWETLLTGRGTAIDRAWVYILLARQLNLDAALLALTEDDGSRVSSLWAVGVLIEGEIYLFDPGLGLPIPKPGTWKMTERGMTVQPATLAEAVADAAVLCQLDSIVEGDYAVTSDDLQHVVALAEAGPAYLSQRMKMVEDRLQGNQHAILTAAPTAQIERFKQCQHVADARLWPHPYQVLWQEVRIRQLRMQWLARMIQPFHEPQTNPLLWQARNYHFRGQFTGDGHAVAFYQQARQSDTALSMLESDPMREALWRGMKYDASYWLGLLMAESGNDQAAEDYLKTRVLLARPGGTREYGAVYNLARVYESLDKVPDAIALYQADRKSPSLQGNLIRARWLKELNGIPHELRKPEPKPEPEKESETPMPEPEETPEEESESKSELEPTEPQSPSATQPREPAEVEEKPAESEDKSAEPEDEPTETKEPPAEDEPEPAAEAKTDAPEPTE